MVAYSTNANIQTDYLPTTDFAPPGAAWRGSHGQVNELIDTACGDMRLDASGVFKVTQTANTAGEAWKLDYDGIQIPWTTGVSIAVSQAALNTALATIFGVGKVLEEDVSSTVLSSPDVTINFADGRSHTITLIPPGGAASTFTAAYTTTPSLAHDHLPGLWVARDTSAFDPQLIHIKQPASASDEIYGIVSNEGIHPTSDAHSSLPGGTPDAWPAGRPLPVWRRGQVVGVARGAVDKAFMSKPVYAVISGVHKGKSMVSDGGTSEVRTLTVTSVDTKEVAITMDGAAKVGVPGTGVAATDAASLAGKLNQSNGYGTKGTFVAVGAVITFTANDRLTHVFTDASTAGSSVAIGLVTPAVAAVAVITRSTFMTPAADGEGVAINVNQG